jgi:hypothetical protein
MGMKIPIRLRPAIRHVRRTFTGPGTLESVAVSKDIVCPEEKAELSPVVFLSGQLEKVTGAPLESTVAAEIRATTAREVNHAATIAYHIRDAALLGAVVYSRNLKYPVSDAFVASKTRPIQIEKAVLASTFTGLKYFGHWMKDDCTLRLLCEDFGNPLCVRIPPHSDIVKYAGYFGQDWSTSTDSAWINHIVIMQDFAQNSFKKQRYEKLRSRIKVRFGGQQASSFVYLKRGATGASRLVHNEAEIIDELLKRGFIVLDVAVDSLEQVLTVLSQARLVVSMEGSHCAHCVAAMPSGSGLMLLEPPNRFCANQRGWTDCLSIRTGFVVGDAVGDANTLFSVSEILKTIDLMLKHV